MSTRRTAEHEAAHAVVAAYYGVPVAEITAGDGRGATTVAACPPRHAAAITAAGDLWERELSTLPYRDAACSDLARLERTVGASGVWRARQDARRVLTIHRRAVLHLAGRLERHGTLVMHGGDLVPAQKSRAA